MRRISASLFLAAALAFCSLAGADTLVVESYQQASSVERPARGVTMSQVEQKFGAPGTQKGPVGEPPISHWVYDDFIVYFEHDRVIHSVVPHR